MFAFRGPAGFPVPQGLYKRNKGWTSRALHRNASGEQLRHHIPMHVGKPEIASLEAVRQLQVIEAEQMH